jgi:hypothetical protein
MEGSTLTPVEAGANNRRTKARYQIRRELRYLVVDRGKPLQSGVGSTVDMGSGGIAFRADQPLEPGKSVELFISWPALLDSVCPMRLCIVGRILRSDDIYAVCTIDRHEFQTRCMSQTSALAEKGSDVQRWLVGLSSRSSAASI